MKKELQQQDRLAVLIDADNAQASIVEGLMAEIAKYGVASIKRIYGDWTNPHLKGWKEVLLDYSIQPIQQFAYTVGKNATDSSMIIDAMDLLYKENLSGFCIISSDSDFTRLCSRIREEGLVVYGFGEAKTPKPFVSACDKFIYTEILRKEDDTTEHEKKSAKELKQDKKLIALLCNAVEDSADEVGWALLATVGKNIAKKRADFDSRNYGYRNLSELFKKIDLFELNFHDKVAYVKVLAPKKRKRGQKRIK